MELHYTQHTYKFAKNPQVVLYRVIAIASFTTHVLDNGVFFENGVTTDSITSKFGTHTLNVFNSLLLHLYHLHSGKIQGDGAHSG